MVLLYFKGCAIHRNFGSIQFSGPNRKHSVLFSCVRSFPNDHCDMAHIVMLRIIDLRYLPMVVVIACMMCRRRCDLFYYDVIMYSCSRFRQAEPYRREAKIESIWPNRTVWKINSVTHTRTVLTNFVHNLIVVITMFRINDYCDNASFCVFLHVCLHSSLFSVSWLKWSSYCLKPISARICVLSFTFKYAEIRLEASYSLISFRKAAAHCAPFLWTRDWNGGAEFFLWQFGRIPIIFRRIVENLGSRHLYRSRGTLSYTVAMVSAMIIHIIGVRITRLQ